MADYALLDKDIGSGVMQAAADNPPQPQPMQQVIYAMASQWNNSP
jgi:hypothetical protein